MQSQHTSYQVPATNPEGLSLIIFRGAEGNTVIEKQKKSKDGRTYTSRYIQLKFDILAANKKGYIKTNVFINPNPDANSEDKILLLNNLGLEVTADSLELEANETEEGEKVSYSLGAGTTDFSAFLDDELPELDDDSFAIEVLEFCEKMTGAKFFCKLVAEATEGKQREYVRYEITPDTVKLAAPPTKAKAKSK